MHPRKASPATLLIKLAKVIAAVCCSMAVMFAASFPTATRSQLFTHFRSNILVDGNRAQKLNAELTQNGAPLQQASAAAAVDGALNPLVCATSPTPSWCSGSDIGAWINAAASTCTPTSQCVIHLPPSRRLTITTPIVFVEHQTLSCPITNQIDSTTGSDTSAQLYYDGSETAITMNTSGDRLEGCDILLGSEVTSGVLMGGNSNQLRDVGIRGGGRKTVLVHVSGVLGGVGVGEDQHIEKSRFSDFIGTGILCDHSNDNFFHDDTMYGKNSNSTGINIIIDSGCTGTDLTNVTGGHSGKNFLKVQRTLPGSYPTYLFARNTECDLAVSDCYVFDGTLNSSLIDYTFVDCWAAGAGGRGFHISGGSNIRLIGCKIRVNGLDGILIDSGSHVSNGIFIEHNLISANNQSKTANTNGITVSGHPVAVSVIGNFIQNGPEPGGNQAYAFSSSSDIEGLIFTNNFCSNNVTGCANVSSVKPTKMTYFGNVAVTAGASSLPQYFLGWAQALNFQANTGSECASRNVTLGAGWGRGASVETVSGYSQTCQFTIISGSASFSAAPTFTFTFPDAFSSTPVCTADVYAITGAGGPILFNNSTPSSTAPAFSATTNAGAPFTPAASETYKVVIRCGP